MEATSDNTYWSPTSNMDYQEAALSNQNYEPQPGEITDPWSNQSQMANFHDMDVSSPYVPSPLSMGATAPNFTGSPYPYPHFQTNNQEIHPFTSQDAAPVSPLAATTRNPARPAPPLPQPPESNLPHLMDPSQRVGLSEMWTLQGMRDMVAFEQLCSKYTLRMKPRGQRKIASATNEEASSSSSFTATNAPSSPTLKAENAGCNTHNAYPLVAMTDTLGSQSDTSVVKPEFAHPDQVVSSYTPPKESPYQDTVLSDSFASTISYPSTTSFASPDAASMSSSVPESIGSPISPVLPSSMTVPSQSPVTPRSTLRHPNILPAPSKPSVPTTTIDLGLNPRQRRALSKASLVGKRNSDASLRNELHSDTNGSASPDIAKSTIQNGPSQTRTVSGPESSKSSGSTRSRRNPRPNPNPNRSNSIPVSDGSNSPEHELTETHSIPAADLDKFFYLPDQGCIGGRKAWMCPKCKKFVRKQDRTSHKLGHEGKKRYDCRCGKQFGRPQDADRHIREQAPCRRCQGKMGRYGKEGFCSACVMEIEQGNNVT